MSGNKVAKNTMYYLIASFLPYVISFGTLPLYTSYLTPEDYGIITLAQSFGFFLPIIMSLQLHSSIYRFFVEYEGRDVKVFLSSVFIFLLFIVGVFSSVIYVALPHFLGYVFPNIPGTSFNLFELAIWISVANIFTGAQTFLIRMREKAKEFMLLSVSLLLVSIVITITEVVYLERGAYGMMESTLLSSLISFLVYTFYNRRYFVLAFKWEFVKAPLLFSLPLIFHSFANYIFMYSDRIILEKYLPVTVTMVGIGLYALADKIAFVMKAVVNQVNEAFLPHFFKTFKVDPEKAKIESEKTSEIVVSLVAFLTIITALFSKEILASVFPEKYYDAWPMIPLLASCFLFRALYNFASMGVVYKKKTWYITITTLSAAVVNIILNFALIPLFGVYGAIYATIFAFFTTFVIIQLVAKKEEHIPMNTKRIGISIISVFTTIAGVHLLNFYVDDFFVEFSIKLIFLITLVLLLFKLEVLDLHKIKRVLKKG